MHQSKARIRSVRCRGTISAKIVLLHVGTDQVLTKPSVTKAQPYKATVLGCHSLESLQAVNFALSQSELKIEVISAAGLD